MFTEYINKVIAGVPIVRIKQNENDASIAPRIKEKDLLIDLNKSSVLTFMRATEHYKRYITHSGRKVNIKSICNTGVTSRLEPHTVVKAGKRSLIVSSNNTDFEITLDNENDLKVIKEGDRINT